MLKTNSNNGILNKNTREQSMSSGKYRITKVKREWDGEGTTKYAVERIAKDGKVCFVDENGVEKNDKVVGVYYDKITQLERLTKKYSKNMQENFVLKVSRLKRNVHNNFVVLTSNLEREAELQEKYPNLNVRVEIMEIKKNNKTVPEDRLVRNFFLGEKDIMQKRIDTSAKINKYLLNLAQKIESLVQGPYWEKFNTNIKHDKERKSYISHDDIQEFQKAFKQQEKGVSSEKLISISFNDKRNLQFKKLLNHIFSNAPTNTQREFDEWLKRSDFQFIYDELVEIKKEHENKKQEKAKKYNHKGTQDKKTLQKRLSVNDGKVYDINKYYQSDWKDDALKNLTESTGLFKKNDVTKIIDDLYKLSTLYNSVMAKKSTITKNPNRLIEVIKAHYKNNVETSTMLTDDEKIVLLLTHQYVKGRYRKFRNLDEIQQTENKLSKLFNNTELINKILKSIENKVNAKKLFEKRSAKHTIKNSFDLELLKANETFTSKLSTAISKAGFTLNIQLFSEKQLSKNVGIDILSDHEKVNDATTDTEVGILQSSMENFKLLHQLTDDETVKQMVLYIQRLRHQVAHYEQNLELTTGLMIGDKDSRNPIDYYQTDQSPYRKHDKLKAYYTQVIENQPEYIFEKYTSNNVWNVLRNNIEDIKTTITQFKYKEAPNANVFPKFHKILHKLEVPFTIMQESETKDDTRMREIKKGACQYFLQQVYYHWFMHCFNFETNVLKQYKEKLKEQIKVNNPDMEAKDIEKRVNNNVIVHAIAFNDIQNAYRYIQQQGSLKEKQYQYNQQWIQFIAEQFQLFMTNKMKWHAYEQYQDFDKDYAVTVKKELFDNVKAAYTIPQVTSEQAVVGQSHSNDEEYIYQFVALASILDLKEISHLRHDIAKYVQFIVKLDARAKNEYTEYVEYTKVLKNVSNVLSAMLEHRERCVQKEGLAENYKDELNNVVFSNEVSDISEIKINIINSQQKTVKQELYKQNDKTGENDKWIVLYGVEQAKRNGTMQFFTYFFSELKHQKYLINSGTLLENYSNLYSAKEENQRCVDVFLADYNKERKENETTPEEYQVRNNEAYKQADTAKQNKLNYEWQTNVLHADHLKIAHNFIADVFAHYLSWAQRLERDDKIKGNIRSRVAHFGYFKYTKMNLLEIANKFYIEFLYSTKYQCDVQTVLNNIFEKYGVVTANGEPVVLCRPKQGTDDYELVMSADVTSKSHNYFSEFKLAHENQVAMLVDLFKYDRK